MLCAVRRAAEARELARDGNRRLTFPSVSDDLYYDTITQPIRAAERGKSSKIARKLFMSMWAASFTGERWLILSLDWLLPHTTATATRNFLFFLRAKEPVVVSNCGCERVRAKENENEFRCGVLTPINRWRNDFLIGNEVGLFVAMMKVI